MAKTDGHILRDDNSYNSMCAMQFLSSVGGGMLEPEAEGFCI
jgi:hypothetical protein